MKTKTILLVFFCCNLCLEVVKNDSKSGTTTPFTRHECKKGKNQLSITDFTTTSVQQNKINVSQQHHEKLREGAVQFICADLRPFRAVECQGLLALVQSAVSLGQAYPKLGEEQVRQILPSRNTVQRDVESKVVTAKQMLKDKLHETFKTFGGFACTSDLWTDSFRQKSYLAITSHFNSITDTQIKHERYMLCLEEVDELVKTKEVVDNYILRALGSYGFSTIDVETSIKFVTDRGPQYKTTDKYTRANCWGHLLNNVVEAMCDDAEAKAVIANAASLVRFTKKSGLNYRLGLSLKSFCDTRWSTVYTMLHSIIPNFETIYTLLEERQKQDKKKWWLFKIH